MKKLHDRYFKQAKREGHLARSYYKLEELDRRNKLFRKNDRVLDLGACPGSWLEYILETVGEGGVACAVDLNPIDPRFKGRVTFRKTDIRELAPDEFREVTDFFDAVVSDMAPSTSGIKSIDQARSQELCETAFAYAEKVLKPGGNFVCKVLEGPDFQYFRQQLKPRFREIKTQKPDASRDESMETYLIGLGYGLPPKVEKELPPKVVEARKKARRKRDRRK